MTATQVTQKVRKKDILRNREVGNTAAEKSHRSYGQFKHP